MNYKLLFLLLFTLEHIYTLVLNIVQARSAANPIPANVADVYDGETYTRWRAYNGEKSKLSILRTIVSWVLTLALLALNFHAAAASIFPDTVFMQLLGVILAQTLVETLVFLGFGWVDTMVIEQKYGFNKTTVKTFVIDQVRNFIIEIILGVILMGLLAWLHISMGDWVILLFTGVVFALTLGISFLYGPVFSRLGNKFVPLEDGELKEKLMALLQKHGYQVKAIEVMDASRRTTKLNAYFTGFGKLKSIVLFDNLVSAMSTDEIVAVFAHELGHAKHRDTLKLVGLQAIIYAAMSLLITFMLTSETVSLALGFDTYNAAGAFIALSAVVLGPVMTILMAAINILSRRFERAADTFAVDNGLGDSLVDALTRLHRDSLADLNPHPFLSAIGDSHPTLGERIQVVRSAQEKRGERGSKSDAS